MSATAHRVRNIVETLKRLPPPSYSGEIYRVPIVKETWEVILGRNNGDDVTIINEECITVKAVRYVRGRREWLEWTIVL